MALAVKQRTSDICLMPINVHSSPCSLPGLSCDLSIHNLTALWCTKAVRALGFYLAYFLDDKKTKVRRESPRSRAGTGVQVLQFLAKGPFFFQRKCSII